MAGSPAPLPDHWKRLVESRDIELEEMAPGLHRQTLTYGHDLMLCVFTFEKGARLPEHSHPHEQAGFVLSGAIELTIAGEIVSLTAGSAYFVKSHEIHSGIALEKTTVLDAFSPAREDYIRSRTAGSKTG